MAVKIIKNGIYPKRAVCPECKAELEYSKIDIKNGIYYSPNTNSVKSSKCEFITCPACGTNISIEEE